MEQLLSMEAEAKNLLAARHRSNQRSFKDELLEILGQAEFLFGPRDSAYQLREPLITECFVSHVIVYPWFARIYLSSNSLSDRQLASYELSHEAIHIMGPAFALRPTVLEEGLATYFSFKYMDRVYGVKYESSGDRHYDHALHAVSALLGKNEFVIKELRARQPIISRIDERLLIEVAGIEPDHANFLCADFQSYARGSFPSTESAAEVAQIFANGFRSIWDHWKSA